MNRHFCRITAGIFALVLYAQNASAGPYEALACKAVKEHDDDVFDAYINIGDANEDITRSGCEDQNAAFLVGVKQGLVGERFAFFYSKGASPWEKQQFFRDYLACSEYGVPVDDDGKVARFDSIVQESSFKHFLKPVRNYIFEAAIAGWKKIKYIFKQNQISSDELRSGFKREVAALEKERQASNELKKIPAALARKKPAEAGTAKSFSCCLEGFMRGAGILSELIKAADNRDCKGFSGRCKDYFEHAKMRAEDACSPKELKACSNCDVEAVLNDTEHLDQVPGGKGLLGCASIGYIRTLRESADCQDALRRRRNEKSAMVTDAMKPRPGTDPAVAPASITGSAGSSANPAIGGSSATETP